MRVIPCRAVLVMFATLGACSRVASTPDVQLGTTQSAVLGAAMWSRGVGGPPDQLNHYGRGVAVDSGGNVLISGEFSGSIDFGCGPLIAVGNSDAFAAKLSPTGACRWSLTLGRAGASQFGRAIAVDPSDDLFLAGDFRGGIDFGSCGTAVSAGGNDIFLVKLGHATGSCLWANRFGDAASQFGRGLAVDATGSVVITGEFFGSIPDFGGGELRSAGDSDVYLAKFSPSGLYQWAHRYGDPSTQLASSVAVDGANNIVLAGSYQGSQVDFGGGSLPPTQGGTYMFVAKFNNAGTHQWSRGFGDSGEHRPNSVNVGSTGDIVVAGDFNGVLNLLSPECPIVSSSGAYDIFLAKLSSTGSCLWSKRFGTTNNQSGTSVALGLQDTIFLTGFIYGAVDFGDGSVQYHSGADAFLAKFNANGVSFGSAAYGDPRDQSGQAVAVDRATGNVLIAGYFAGTIDFGGQPLVSPNGFDIFVVQFANACDASNCSAGCCDGAVCRASSLAWCGTLGSTCVACDLDKADNCATGQCRCGTGASCGTGQRCLGGVCRCDSVSCSTGCCNDSACTVSSFASCGSSGRACIACDAQRANNCFDGQCRCGTRAACAVGQYCDGSACRCNSASCPTGCCSADSCHVSELSACGTGGGSCAVCSTTLADNCANGQCRCGPGAACAAGQRCVSGTCRCDPSSCPNGCCDANNVCRTGTELSACGTRGEACAACAGDTCSTGVCACSACGAPGSCHACSCADSRQCGQYPACHDCTCADFGTCNPAQSCAWLSLCGEWPKCGSCSGAPSPNPPSQLAPALR